MLLFCTLYRYIFIDSSPLERSMRKSKLWAAATLQGDTNHERFQCHCEGTGIVWRTRPTDADHWL